MTNHGTKRKDDKIVKQLPLSIPIISSEEIVVFENILGEGGFCTVSPVRRIKLFDDDNDNRSSSSAVHPPMEGSSDEKVEARYNFAKQFQSYEQEHYTQKQIVIPGHTPPLDPMDTVRRPPKVALKRVKADIGKKRYQIGVNDLFLEASVLAKCSHPNIISLYAVGCDDDKEKHEANDGGMLSIKSVSFAIVDQLQSTLKNKFYKWKEDNTSGIIRSKKTANSVWLERMVVIIKIADAVNYLHSKGIVHRDINPGNIGFTDDNVVKLFDFGLAKSVKGEKSTVSDDIDVDENENETYDLTGFTGTIRYMAPEIALGLPYGLKVDVHSFALVMYEILSLSQPYQKVDADDFHEIVFVDGLRPTVSKSWPQGITELLEKMWSPDIAKRSSSKDVIEVLGDLLRGKDNDLYPSGWMKRLTVR